jgi:thiol-disulfide isomerase/thioredoxin
VVIIKRKKVQKKKFNRIWLYIVIFVFAIVAFSAIFILSQPSNQPSNNNEGDDFTYTSLDGGIKSLSDHRGKIVIVDMWATWCSPCVYEMIELYKLYNNYSRNDLEVISINIANEDTQKIQDFIYQFENDLGYTLNWEFGMEIDNNLDKYMQEAAIPTLCVFDQQGILKFRHAGLSFYNEIPSNWPSESDEPPLLSPIVEELM